MSCFGYAIRPYELLDVYWASNAHSFVSLHDLAVVGKGEEITK